ncbi:MAG: ZIP family metal transporter [Longimicrobiales bacterium]
MIASLAYAAVAGLATLIGGFIVTAGAARRELPVKVLVGFGGGFMLAVALLEMLPAGMRAAHGLSAVLIGYLAVHLTQHTMTPHFHFGEETHADLMSSRGVGVWALVGLLPHNFFDGVAIASGVAASAELGLLVFLAVLLHKVPTGVSLASVMMASGNSAQTTISAVSITGAATILGALVTPVVAPLAEYGLALSAGVTIYVAASNLIPEAQHEPGWKIPGAVFLGVVAFWFTRLLLPGH